MPRTVEANQRIRDAQREKILASARRVFAARGWAATMSDIAADAGVSQGLAYRYFASKEDIFRQLVEGAVQAGLEAIQQIDAMPGTAGERLAFLVTWTFRRQEDRVDFYQFSLRGLGDTAAPEDLRELLRQPRQAYQDLLRSLIVEGQAAGEVAPGDPDQLVLAIIACFDGLSRFQLRGSEYFRKHFPDAGIILRMLKP